jgi:hypothetical protein
VIRKANPNVLEEPPNRADLDSDGSKHQKFVTMIYHHPQQDSEKLAPSRFCQEDHMDDLASKIVP